MGLINAALAGFFLACLYRKTKAVHGLAWGHAAYNIAAYMLS
jgi:hypothetical protein